MSRYHGISNPDTIKSIITPGGYSDAQPITFSPGSKVKKSFLVKGGSEGTTSNSRKSGVGEY